MKNEREVFVNAMIIALHRAKRIRKRYSIRCPYINREDSCLGIPVIPKTLCSQMRTSIVLLQSPADTEL